MIWITIGIVANIVAVFVLIITLIEEHKWAKQDGRKMFRDKSGNWNV